MSISGNFCGFLILGDVGEDGGDETYERGFAREDAGDPGAAVEFLINPFEWVGGAETLLMNELSGLIHLHVNSCL